LLPRHSSCLRPWPLMPLLNSGCTQCLFLNIHFFRVPLVTLFLPGLWWSCALCGAGVAWQVNRQRAAANFFRDLPLLWVHFFGRRWRPMARCWFPHQSCSAPTVSTSASSVETSWCSTADFISFWICLSFLWIGLHHFLAGHHLFSTIYHFF
jgi:hypothetical protein